jgi:hypothetical protein
LQKCLKACALLCSFVHESRKFPRAANRPNSGFEPGTELTIVVVKVRAWFESSIEFIITDILLGRVFITLLLIDFVFAGHPCAHIRGNGLKMVQRHGRRYVDFEQATLASCPEVLQVDIAPYLARSDKSRARQLCHPRHSVSPFRSNFLVFLASSSPVIPVVLIWPSQSTSVPTNMIPSARATRPSPKTPSRAPFVTYLTPLFFTISANSFPVSCSTVSHYCCLTTVFIRPCPGSHKHLSPEA